jgi:hypothetical protein
MLQLQSSSALRAQFQSRNLSNVCGANGRRTPSSLTTTPPTSNVWNTRSRSPAIFTPCPIQPITPVPTPRPISPTPATPHEFDDTVAAIACVQRIDNAELLSAIISSSQYRLSRILPCPTPPAPATTPPRQQTLLPNITPPTTKEALTPPTIKLASRRGFQSYDAPPKDPPTDTTPSQLSPPTSLPQTTESNTPTTCAARTPTSINPASRRGLTHSDASPNAIPTTPAPIPDKRPPIDNLANQSTDSTPPTTRAAQTPTILNPASRRGSTLSDASAKDDPIDLTPTYCKTPSSNTLTNFHSNSTPPTTRAAQTPTILNPASRRGSTLSDASAEDNPTDSTSTYCKTPSSNTLANLHSNSTPPTTRAAQTPTISNPASRRGCTPTEAYAEDNPTDSTSTYCKTPSSNTLANLHSNSTPPTTRAAQTPTISNPASRRGSALSDASAKDDPTDHTPTLASDCNVAPTPAGSSLSNRSVDGHAPTRQALQAMDTPASFARPPTFLATAFKSLRHPHAWIPSLPCNTPNPNSLPTTIAASVRSYTTPRHPCTPLCSPTQPTSSVISSRMLMPACSTLPEHYRPSVASTSPAEEPSFVEVSALAREWQRRLRNMHKFKKKCPAEYWIWSLAAMDQVPECKCTDRQCLNCDIESARVELSELVDKERQHRTDQGQMFTIDWLLHPIPRLQHLPECKASRSCSYPSVPPPPPSAIQQGLKTLKMFTLYQGTLLGSLAALLSVAPTPYQYPHMDALSLLRHLSPMKARAARCSHL